MSDQLHTAALSLAAHGFNVVPMGRNKKAAMKWKDFQQRPQTQEELRLISEWPDLHGIAVVCGCEWNRLGVRDFDSMEAANEWKSRNRSLAKILPSVQSARGLHFWFGAAPFKSKKFDDGELRGIGNLAIAPPSLHKSGVRYQWTKPLTDRLPEVDPAVFLPARADTESDAEVLQRELSNRENRETEAIASVLSVTPRVEHEIALCLPAVEGQRHRKLFELARRLRSVPEFAAVNATACHNAVRRWHELALPVIGTKPWDATWCEFIVAWPNVKTAFGEGSVKEALTRADAATFPASLNDQYEAEAARRLLKLCRELDQVSRPGPFYLSCKTTEETLGIDRMTAWRYFRRMVAENVLEVTENHTKAKATRYRYVGPAK